MLSQVLGLLHLDPYENLLREHTAERLRKALSPTYLRDKLALLFYEKRHPDHPWLTRASISLLEAHLRPDHQGFEWGSGVGSLWLAERSGSLISVEHDPRWHGLVQRRSADRALHKDRKSVV